MNLIVAVYDDWGIGRDGTQPVALNDDRKFFRQMTKGAMILVGRRTILDFPGQKPLPGRINVAITRQNIDLPGFTVVHSPEEAVELAKTAEKAFVTGGGSVYRQMLPYCDTAYITKVHCTIDSDTYFPDLDADPQWKLAEIMQSGKENGIAYEMCVYTKKGTT